MNVKDKTGPLVVVEFLNPVTGKYEMVAVRFETIEMTQAERKNVTVTALANVPDPRLLLLRNYILGVCMMTPHVIPAENTTKIDTDNQDDGQHLGG